jgi:hypothetical protein
MRRSSVVRLTLLPVLASAAVASAQSAPSDPPPSDAPPGDAPPADAPPADAELAPPSASAPELQPPGMTPTIYELDCDHDPNWQLRPDCLGGEDDGVVIVRGGFGSYFWSGAGG